MNKRNYTYSRARSFYLAQPVLKKPNKNKPIIRQLTLIIQKNA